jgi:hypothetical protein
MAMARSTSILTFGLLLAVSGCGVENPRPKESVDCSAGDQYEFTDPSAFSSNSESNWFDFGDNTPNATMSFHLVQNPHPRCGDAYMMEFIASGHNFYGVGFGDWTHQEKYKYLGRANGTGYEGISFWARSQGNVDKTFMFYMDDGRTFTKRSTDSGGLLLPVSVGDQDLDGDGFMGPGDIFNGTSCRVPPIQALGDPACYHGGVLAPGSPTRVPAPDECGNQFHTYITTTENWQLFLIPWNQLVQWPCPNRLASGIDPSDIAQIEIKLLQGTNYDLLLDSFAFYRRRVDAGD